MEAIAGYTDLRPHGQAPGRTSWLATPPGRLRAGGPVVLTTFEPVLEPDRLALVVEELHVAAAVSSPQVLRILDVGDQHGQLFYATEHLAGGTLDDPAGELERAGILKVVADAARGAHALHEAGLAHGAISPATIVLHDDGAKLGVPSLDHLLRPGMTVAAGALVTSTECADPAIVRGGPAGRTSDIWSLGVTLHRAISGRSPYGEERAPGDLFGAVVRLLSDRPVVADGVEPDVAGLVTACLAVDPGDRPSTALAVAEWLEELP